MLSYDDDTTRCPNQRPAYLRSHVDGHWMPEHFDDPDPQWNLRRVEICRSHIRALATVHEVDWRSLGFAEILPVPASPEHAAHHLIDLHEAHLDDARMVAHPVVTRGIARLRETAPSAGDLRLVKGTNGLGEEVFAGTDLVAMSDWELAAIGDPAYDFAQLQGFIDRIEHDGEVIWSLDHALAYYRELTGRTIERAAVKWYRTLYGLIMFTFASRAARALAEGRDHQARLAWVAIEMQHHGQARLAAAFGIRAERPTDESKGR
ncbi:protein kinase family protein [Ilumatobacter coccineus]|uniref:hypothetical protein n=1 Tax=Ilumatobacter coccineus TaxID=467094 RepID=UPI0012B69DAE|nr:hypothetical protein [Ilumatobacter coccineus]